jgi:hypothetical protein
MNNNTKAALILDIVDSIRKTRQKNCDKWGAEGNSILNEEQIGSMLSITVKEDVEDVTEILEWSEHTGRMIQSVDDYEAYSLWEVYYDLHKDVYGVKARHTKWFDHDAKGWQEALDSLSSQS